MHPIAFTGSEYHIPVPPKKLFAGEPGAPTLSVRHPNQVPHMPTVDRIGTVSGGTTVTVVASTEALGRLLSDG